MGIPPSGNGKFIVIAVLIVAGIGGALVWKLSQKPSDTVTVTMPLPTAGSSRKKIDDDIPLPPEVEDAGDDAGDDAGKKVTVASAGSPCDVKSCGGKATADLEQTLAFRAKQAHRCYDSALSQDPTLKGKVSIAVRVAANGTVCAATVASNDMGTPTVANCVAGYFRGGTVPSPKGGCVEVNVPINFVPRQ